jgi:hypothetical protein
MCDGPTPQETEIQNDQIQAYQQASQLTQEQYANQQAIYGPMVAKYSSIFNQGPSQQGFSQGEENDLNAQAVEGTAENYSQAAKAVNENLDAEGGGNNPLPSGSQAQLKEEVATSASANESNEENEIQQADFSQGYNEWLNAGQGLTEIAAGENPLGYESAETSSGSAASSTSTEIASQEDSWLNAALGAGGAVGTAVVNANPGDVFG